MRPVVAIAGVELRRFLADRANLFFVFIFPLALVTVIGLQFGGGDGPGGRVALVAPDGELSTALTQQWEGADLSVEVVDSADQLRTDVARGSAEVGIVVPQEAMAAYEDGEPIPLEIIAGSDGQAPAVAQVVRSGADAVGMRGTQVGTLSELADSGDARAALERSESSVPGPTVLVQEPDDPIAQAFAGVGQFEQGAASQLLLFIFINTLAASATLIKARRDGVIRRTIAAPVSTTQTIVGLAAGRLVIALFQGVYIIAATSLLFGVDWGNLGVVMLVVLVFGLIASGAAMLIGVLVDSEGPASGVAVGGGLVLAAIGGCMVPLEIFPPTLTTIAHFTPHAWAYDALAEVQRRGGGVADIALELGVLLAIAAVVLIVASALLRRSLSRAM